MSRVRWEGGQLYHTEQVAYEMSLYLHPVKEV